MNPIEILLQSLDLAIENKLWADKKPSEVFKILMYVYNKGWLYRSTVNDKISAVICCYRIKEGDSLTEMPVKEEGTILYIPFVLSINKEDNMYRVAKESLRIYLEENPDITEIILEDKKNQIKRYKIGAENGEESKPHVTENARV